MLHLLLDSALCVLCGEKIQTPSATYLHFVFLLYLCPHYEEDTYYNNHSIDMRKHLRAKHIIKPIRKFCFRNGPGRV